MTGLKIALLFGCLALVAGRTLTVQKTSVSLTEESQDSDTLNDILRTFLAYSDVTSGKQYGDIVQDCSKGKCNFCKEVLRHEACFAATLEKDSILLEVTLDKKEIMKTVIKGPNPPAVCKKSIPDIPALTDVCVQVKDVNLKEASGCIYVSFKFHGRSFPEKKIECFKIPTNAGSNQITEAEWEEVEGQDVGTEMHDGTVLKFDTMNK